MKNWNITAAVAPVMLVMSVVGACTCFAQKGLPQAQDSLLIGRRVATNPTDHYIGELEYNIWFANTNQGDSTLGDISLGHEAVWVVVPGKGIVFLEIDNQLIVDDGDEPLKVFPHPVGGQMQAVYAFAAGISDGEEVSYGGFYKDSLKAGEPLNFNMQMSSVLHVVEFNPVAGTNLGSLEIRMWNPDETYQVESNWSNYYDGFPVWLRPGYEGDYRYEILSNGQVIQTGVVAIVGDDGEEVNPTPEDSGMAFILPGGVLEVDLADGHWDELSGLTMDGQTRVNGEMVPAKVLVLKPRKEDSRISGSIEEINGATVDLYVIGDDGQLSSIPHTGGMDGDEYDFQVDLPEKGAAVVAVIRDVQYQGNYSYPSVSPTFGFWAYSWNSWYGGGRG